MFALFSAIKENDYEKIRNLLSTVGSETVNQVDESSGLSAIQYTLRLRPLTFPQTESILKILLSFGANVNQQNTKSGKTALHYLLRVDSILTNRSLMLVKPI